MQHTVTTEYSGADASHELRKLVIQIPCLNEESSLPATLKELPRHVEGYDIVEWLVIDDGSTDRTAEVAKACGVDHVLRLRHRHGLAKAFMAGMQYCVQIGAHTIVNTDADNQYSASCIPSLVKPILSGKAEIVIGARPIEDIREFSRLKKLLQRLGSFAVRVASDTDIPDAPSGFRAITRRAAIDLMVFNPYTYTIETIIQAGRNGIPISSVPISVNPSMRPSRLISSPFNYVIRSLGTIIRIFIIYRPVRFFGFLSLLFFCPGALAILRFLYLYASGHGTGHVQSIVLAAALLAISSVLMIAGVLAELIAANRLLLEQIRRRQMNETNGGTSQTAMANTPAYSTRDK